MSELTPDDEALISAARGGLEATPEDQARIKRKLFAQIGIATGIAGSAISTSTAASAGAAGAGAATTTVVAGTTLTTKLFLAVILIGTAGGAIAIERSAKTPNAVTPTASAPLSPTQSIAPPPEVAPAITPAITPTIDPTPALAITNAPVSTSLTLSPKTNSTPTRDHAPTNDSVSAPTAAITETPAPPQVTAVPTGPTTVDAEAALLRNADAALKSGDAPGALALVDQHAKQFPNGILAEERDAERVVVLCALGRTDEARAAGAAFLRARPRSPLASRVRASCAGN